ncbi:MAG: hypothetical protein KF855_08735 [Acidobacteria bacterium]|nr:hypothetical protein [Acidobacteriota bacterium]
MNTSFKRLFGTAAVLIIAAGSLLARGEETGSTRSSQPLVIRAVAWGPDNKAVDRARQRIEKHPNVQAELRGSRYMMLSFEYIEDQPAEKNAPTPEPTRFRVVFYNYTEDVTVIAEAGFDEKEPVTVRRDMIDPWTTPEEIKAAYQVIEKDAAYIAASRKGPVEMYEPMPPISKVNGERLVNIGIRNADLSLNEIVGVSFKNNTVVRYENGIPETNRMTAGTCGVPSGGGGTGPGIAGQAVLTINEPRGTSDVPMWEMLVVRPSASSGAQFERSGIEVRDVKYKGKSVLKRGHAPVLNVKYLPGASCNAYRDWQYSEGNFQAPSAGAQDPAPGIRILAPGQKATTIVENYNDGGNFNGVAIYQEDTGNPTGPEVVLVSEMNAGWYRYIMEWRFGTDGTIRPRYGFGSITSTCVCSPRNHHVYWRLDFDVVQPQNKVFQIERGRKFRTPVTTELASFRSYQLNRGYLIQNADGNEAYQVIPGMNDGEAYFTNPNGQVETFGAGDFWLLKFQGTANSPGELDDPSSGTGCPSYPAACLAPWVNNESLDGEDVVIWYSAHQFRIDDTSLTEWRNNVLAGKHVIGPDLRPVRW